MEQDKKEYVKYENDIKEEKERCEQDIEEYNKLTKKYKDNIEVKRFRIKIIKFIKII